MLHWLAERLPAARLARTWIVIVGALAATGCGRCGGRDPSIVGRFHGGVVTAEDLKREANRLPPVLRARFETDAGRRDMVSAVIDKRLLLAEARRRKLDEDPDLRLQVRELEERLALQALLTVEEKQLGAATDAELRAFYEAHANELGQPERVRVRRVLASVGPAGSHVERERARERAERFATRLRGGERFEKVAADGEGPERARGGDLGLIAKGEGRDPRLEAAAFALERPGARSPVVSLADGFAVLELVERRPGRVPSFEEARGEVANRLAPQRKRRAFDDLLARLRKEADVAIDVPAHPR